MEETPRTKSGVSPLFFCHWLRFSSDFASRISRADCHFSAKKSLGNPSKHEKNQPLKRVDQPLKRVDPVFFLELVNALKVVTYFLVPCLPMGFVGLDFQVIPDQNGWKSWVARTWKNMSGFIHENFSG